MESRSSKKNTLRYRLNFFRAVQGILNNSSDIIENLRTIWNNWNRAGVEQYHKSYWGITGVESETDTVPRGEDRLAYSEEELQIIDKDADDYIQKCLPSLIEDCQLILDEYTHEKLFPEEKAKLKIRKLAQDMMAGQIEPHGGLGEILSLWQQTDLEEGDFYFYILGAYETGESNTESFKSSMQAFINYCDEMLIFPADSLDLETILK